MAVTPSLDGIVDRTIEQQGEAFLRIRERSHATISAEQYLILQEHEERLGTLGLRLSVDLDGERFLHATDTVGTFRLTDAEDRWLVVEVAPKVEAADVFRMIDRTSDHLPEVGDLDSEISSGEAPVSTVFLRFFVRQVRRFLEKNHYRNYRFVETNTSSGVRGCPLIADYSLRNLPRGQAHIMPSRYLELSQDVLENQVLAYSIEVAQRLVSVFDLNSNPGIAKDLRACKGSLAGVNSRPVTARELFAIRYSRSNVHFRGVHRLCGVLLRNETIVMDTGDRIPFAAFSLHMPTLFQKYVSSLMMASLGHSFEDRKNELTFLTGFGARPIKLDGLISSYRHRIVVEAKYRALERADDELVLGVVPERHIYQTIAYAMHEKVRASKGIIVYPIWDRDGPPARVSDEISDFGWGPKSPHGVGLRLLGVDLGAPFHEVAEYCAVVLDPVLSSA
ncbi:5-methylcytosine restriction system specificity protein McrC [Candidatus Poriferisocius sp.]|uniref:5-methylcytosine restriction system specificity protein McrC n=1 Tax=Candidatus Poriferisocius sp. TaxID=3101276 RepID=UPI003B5A9342